MNKSEAYNSKAIENILNDIDPKLEKHIEFRMRLAAKIDNAREKKGWSKKQFAEKLSKRPSEISKWLSGTHNFTTDTLFDIQLLMGVELINLDDKPREQIIHFHIEISQTEAEKGIYNDNIKPSYYPGFYSKSASISNSIPGLKNLKTVIKA